MIAALAACGRNGRSLLLAGLVLGLAASATMPGLVARLQPLVAPLVITLLALAIARMGPPGLRAATMGLRAALASIVALQLALPVGVAIIASLAGWSGLLITGLVVVLAAAPIIGAPSLTVICGGNPVPALRQLVVGTALLPLTALPVFALLPALGDPVAVLWTALRLAGLIALAGVAGLALRRFVGAAPQTLQAVDGTAALILAVVVIALMSAAGPALTTPQGWITLATLMAVTLSLQAINGWTAQRLNADPLPLSIAAGNRNLALFLGALPAPLALELLPFVGLYQIPLYLTPVLLPRLYALSGLSPTASRQ